MNVLYVMNHAMDEGAALCYIISHLIKQSNVPISCPFLSFIFSPYYIFFPHLCDIIKKGFCIPSLITKNEFNKEALDRIVIDQIKLKQEAEGILCHQ